MTAFVVTLHVIACLVLIVLVLLQSGKEGMGVIFGGGSESMFGASGAGGLLVKVTAVVAIVFLLTSLTYNKLTGGKQVKTDSIVLEAPMPVAPVVPEKKPDVTFEQPAQPQGAEQAAPAQPAEEKKQ